MRVIAMTRSSLPDGPAGAVDDLGVPALDGAQGRRVVLQDESRVYVIRELEEPFDKGGGDVRGFESRTLERITGSSNVPDGTWLLTSADPCAQRLVAGGQGNPATPSTVELADPLGDREDVDTSIVSARPVVMVDPAWASPSGLLGRAP